MGLGTHFRQLFFILAAIVILPSCRKTEALWRQCHNGLSGLNIFGRLGNFDFLFHSAAENVIQAGLIPFAVGSQPSQHICVKTHGDGPLERPVQALAGRFRRIEDFSCKYIFIEKLH
jgi:hypothetical protein